ncbi:hypothetical protein J9303_13280 [Bacillaceae bacterium Marseille-Q3522]|nr:hypothetical protein [Bacillaceae bacterium Marseille-Q3522]
MPVYKLTVFENNGELLLNESITADNDADAKREAENQLKDKGFLHKTHRCTSATGKLVLFHS